MGRFVLKEERRSDWVNFVKRLMDSGGSSGQVDARIIKRISAGYAVNRKSLVNIQKAAPKELLNDYPDFVTNFFELAGVSLDPRRAKEDRLDSESAIIELGQMTRELLMTNRISKEDLPKAIEYGSWMIQSDVEFFTPHTYAKRVLELDDIEKICFVLTCMEDSEDPYYSMVREFVLTRTVCEYLIAEGDIESQIEINKLKKRLMLDQEIIEDEIDVSKHVTFDFIPESSLTTNQAFYNPGTTSAESQAYSSIRGRGGRTVLIYQMPPDEKKRNWERVKEGLKVLSKLRELSKNGS